MGLIDAKKKYLEGICKEHTTQPKKVWNELNKILGCNAQSQVTQLRTDTAIITSPPQIANKLNCYFTNLAKPSPNHLETNIIPWTDSSFCFQKIQVDEVLSALKKLNVHKATGVDGISAYLLQLVAVSIAPCLTSMFNSSLSCGEISTEWKRVNVIPIPKCPSADQISDF